MDLAPLAILLVVLAVAAGFFIQTVIGFAAPLIALPVLTRILGIQAAVGLISIYLLAFSIVMARKHWREIDRPTVLELTISGVIGVGIGVWALQYWNPVVLNKLLGAIILLTVVQQIIGQKKIAHANKLGWLFGFVAGIFSGMFSSGGPLYVAYIYSKLSKPDIIRATTIVALAVGNALRFILLTFNGVIDAKIWHVAVYVLPGFLLAIWFGQHAFRRLNDLAFKRLVLGLLVVSGLSLIAL